MAVSKYVPIVGHTGGNYTAGGDPWSNTARRVEPSIAQQAAGATPKQGLGAQHWNFLFSALGEKLIDVLYAPSFDWTVYPPYEDATGTLSNGTAGNENKPDDMRLIYPQGERWLIKSELGNNPFWSRREGQGLRIDSDTDTGILSQCASAGADADPLIISRTRGSPNRIVVVQILGGAPGTVRYSDDYGATWSAGGTAASSATGVFYNGVWSIPVNFATGQSNIRFSSTLSGSWSSSSTLNHEDCDWWRAIQDAPAAIFLPGSGSATKTDILVDTGSGWQVVTVTTLDNRTGWRGDYNANLGMYLLGNAQGELFTSTNATSWSLALTHTSAIYDVAAHGPGWIISSGTEDFSGTAQPAFLEHVRFDHTNSMKVRRIGFESPATWYNRFHLIRHRGRVIAARVANAADERLEWWISGAYPFDIEPLTGV